jgi:hypothetical protein
MEDLSAFAAIECQSFVVVDRYTYPTLKSRISLRLADVDILRRQIGGAASGGDSVWLALILVTSQLNHQ